jgi:nitroimidazol reductase NimA-like FMN-containing flavoprotein (pyridoxamine 5'-phosphate oxidase superfamily)
MSQQKPATPTDRVPPSSPPAPAPVTDRTRIRRHADRAVPDRIEEFLRAGLVAHLACVEDGLPRTIPIFYLYEAGRLYFHGSPSNRSLGLVADGRPVAVSVALLDEMVASRTEAGQSANYRSVVVYGHGRAVTDLVEKRRVMLAMARRYLPERETPRDFAPATEDDLRGMTLVAVDIDEASAKARSGPAMGPLDGDPDAPGTAYVRPVIQR